jgi:high-affinity iron transporter
VAAASIGLAAGAAAGSPAPWRSASDAREALADAESALVLDEDGAAATALARARRAVETALARRPVEWQTARAALDRAGRALAEQDGRGLSAAAATVWTAILAAAHQEARRAAARGDAAGARAWLLVREFRPPTRFSRAAADATIALDDLERGRISPARAAEIVGNDLLDTYDGRLRSSLSAVREASLAGLLEYRAEAGALVQGYWRILRPSFLAQRGAVAARRADQAVAALSAWTLTEPMSKSGAAIGRVQAAVEGFRAAPLSEEETLRRAGQVERFLRLVPIEYGRGVKNGRVLLDFEVQEAITFRDGAEAAYRDVAPILLTRDRPAARRVQAVITRLGHDLASASRGLAVADPEAVEATANEALDILGRLYPAEWKDAAKTADFDVISATLDRLQAAAASGDWSRAESARLEAYGIFELGPEQRLRGLAPDLFRETEGYFWYGAKGQDGLVQLIKRKASTAELAATRHALDDVLRRSEERIGAGPQSSTSVVVNSAIIVFREGLEAVLILAALLASLVGVQRGYRRPLLAGAGVALVASAITWVVAQTVLTSLAGFGERLEAIVSLVAIAVLLLILNWFYHRVYWQENLQDLHRRKRRILAGAGLSLAAAQAAGLVALGFSSVYREGFETVLFLQALTLEAGAFTVLQGVALGFAGVLAVFFLVVGLERKLPHKKMLIATGLLITWVLVVMVGTTVQTLQKIGWLAVSPIEGLDLPYWAGLWLGLYPTWEGLVSQGGAVALVLGSYVAAEQLRARRRRRIATPPRPAADLRLEESNLAADPGPFR